METQGDNQIRVVSLSNLKAMCERESMIAHRYWIESVSKTRVRVGYSNPDEYGNDNPVYAVFPCYPSVWQPADKDNPCVVLDMLRCEHDRDGYAWQGFDALLDCPRLWRDGGGNWQTEDEIKAKRPDSPAE